MKNRFRLLFPLFAFLNLVFGVLAGFGRLGMAFVVPEIIVHHGAVMVGGFLGTLISLEKVIPLKKKSLLAVPLLSGMALLVFFLEQFEAGVIMLIASSAGLVLTHAIYLYRQKEYFQYLMLGGALCWFTGNVMLLNQRFYPAAFPWWMGFLLFTIVSERLELSKFLPVPARSKVVLLAFLVLFFVGLVIPFHGPGTWFSGIALILISLWLMRYDIIRVNLRKEGLPRFSGYALTFGYTALLMDGIFLIAFPEVVYAYDAIVHTFFLGFVFCMIFAHGPIILPGVLGLTVRPYHAFLYVPLVTLVCSVLVRVFADAGLISESYRTFSAWLSAGAILVYFVTLFITTLRKVQHAKIF